MHWLHFVIFFPPCFFSCWRAFQKIFLIFTGMPGIWKTFYFIFFTQFFPFYLTFLAPAQPVLFRSETSLLLVSGRALAGCFASPSVQSGPACPCRIFAFKVLMSVLPSHSGLFNECLVIFLFFFSTGSHYTTAISAWKICHPSLCGAAGSSYISSQLDGTIVLKFYLKFWPAGCKRLRGSVPVHIYYISPISCIKPFHIYDPWTSPRHAHDVKKKKIDRNR